MMLKSFVNSSQIFNGQTGENRTKVSLGVFPNHMTLDIWVEAHNKLGKIESEHLKKDAGWFGKLNVVVLYE